MGHLGRLLRLVHRLSRVHVHVLAKYRLVTGLIVIQHLWMTGLILVHQVLMTGLVLVQHLLMVNLVQLLMRLGLAHHLVGVLVW